MSTTELVAGHDQISQAVDQAANEECLCLELAQASPQASIEEARAGRILELKDPIPRVHDPVMAKEGDTYYLFCTGRGVAVHTSRDMVTWERQRGAFEQPMTWTAETIPGSRDFYWAPDISYFNGKWHLYYSVSTFGRNHSAIGLATNVTLDSKRPDYHWQDEGLVVGSELTDDWNAIDPNTVLDEHQQLWMTLGSFWGGVKLLRLDPSTGKPEKDYLLYSLASRPHTKEVQGSVEGPFIVHRHGLYYLFASFDFCCRGIRSTYNIRVGRSSEITGPYVDREGTPMLESGGTLVLAGSGRWVGPGHNSIYRENDTDWMIYHAYDAEDNGYSKLRIEELTWDAAGWPQAPSMALLKDECEDRTEPNGASSS
jgi:arabinan endo-1,5-alpha-L-arabinosidase